MTMDQKTKIERLIKQLLEMYQIVQQTVDKIAESPTNNSRVELLQ